jgi:plasmid stability protein
LILRHLDPALVARVRAFAHEHGRSLPEAAALLLTMALDSLEARQRGAAAINDVPKVVRSERARLAAQARWRDR